MDSSWSKFSFFVRFSASKLFRDLTKSWFNCISSVLEEWEDSGSSDTSVLLSSAREALSRWPESVVKENSEYIDLVFNSGFLSGAADADLPPISQKNVKDLLAWIKENPSGFIPALNDMASFGYRRMEKIVKEGGLNLLVDRIYDEVGLSESRIELIVRTEVAKSISLGKLAAWGQDPNRDKYDYIWIAYHDNKTKDVSLLFERMGPYTWEQMYHIWIYEHNRPQKVRNRKTGKWEYQTSAYNCRCNIVRLPKRKR